MEKEMWCIRICKNCGKLEVGLAASAHLNCDNEVGLCGRICAGKTDAFITNKENLERDLQEALEVIQTSSKS